MIIISKDRKQLINFDNVTNIELFDNDIIAYYVSGGSELIGSYNDVETAKNAFTALTLNYRGSAVIPISEVK